MHKLKSMVSITKQLWTLYVEKYDKRSELFDNEISSEVISEYNAQTAELADLAQWIDKVLSDMIEEASEYVDELTDLKRREQRNVYDMNNVDEYNRLYHLIDIIEQLIIDIEAVRNEIINLPAVI